MLMQISDAHKKDRIGLFILKTIRGNLEDVKWENDLCYASISHVKGVPIKEHLATTEEENKDKLVKQIDLFNSEDSNPKDINWVPEDFRQ